MKFSTFALLFFIPSLAIGDPGFVELWNQRAVNLIGNPKEAFSLLNESSDKWQFQEIFQQWSTAKTPAEIKLTIPLNRSASNDSFLFPCLMVATLLRTNKFDQILTNNPKFRIQIIDSEQQIVVLKPWKQRTFWLDNSVMWKLFMVKVPTGTKEAIVRGIGAATNRRFNVMESFYYSNGLVPRRVDTLQYFVEAFGLVPGQNMNEDFEKISYEYENYEDGQIWATRTTWRPAPIEWVTGGGSNPSSTKLPESSKTLTTIGANSTVENEINNNSTDATLAIFNTSDTTTANSLNNATQDVPMATKITNDTNQTGSVTESNAQLTTLKDEDIPTTLNAKNVKIEQNWETVETSTIETATTTSTAASRRAPRVTTSTITSTPIATPTTTSTTTSATSTPTTVSTQSTTTTAATTTTTTTATTTTTTTWKLGMLTVNGSSESNSSLAAVDLKMKYNGENIRMASFEDEITSKVETKHSNSWSESALESSAFKKDNNLPWPSKEIVRSPNTRSSPGYDSAVLSNNFVVSQIEENVEVFNVKTAPLLPLSYFERDQTLETAPTMTTWPTTVLAAGFHGIGIHNNNKNSRALPFSSIVSAKFEPSVIQRRKQQTILLLRNFAISSVILSFVMFLSTITFIYFKIAARPSLVEVISSFFLVINQHRHHHHQQHQFQYREFEFSLHLILKKSFVEILIFIAGLILFPLGIAVSIELAYDRNFWSPSRASFIFLTSSTLSVGFIVLVATIVKTYLRSSQLMSNDRDDRDQSGSS